MSTAIAQQHDTALSPSEALTSAMAPFNAARAQPNDLTEADNIALGVGVAHASRDCEADSADPHAYADDADQLLALGRLCIFGQQFEPARAALVRYLTLPRPPQRELSLLLLVRAFLGLKSADSAQAQVLSLLSDYPYDASIHYATDHVIDAEEGRSFEANEGALRLCDKQAAATLPLLLAGKSLVAKDGTVAPSVLYGDALRCAALARSANDPSARIRERQALLVTIPQNIAWQNTAELAPMRASLARWQMKVAPLQILHGSVISPGGTLLSHPVSLRQGVIAMMPFTLWSPSSLSTLQALVASAPLQPVLAITSWSANTGQADIASPELLRSLRTFQASLPKHSLLLIVPDSELHALQTDQFPAGIVIRNGNVVFDAPLDGEGAMRMISQTLPSGPAPPQPPHNTPRVHIQNE